jgi:nitroreductase
MASSLELSRRSHSPARRVVEQDLGRCLGVASVAGVVEDHRPGCGAVGQGDQYAPDSGDPRLTADVGMYAQTLLLAMAAHGIASCPQAMLSFYADTVREVLGVVGGTLLFGVSFGYADPAAAINAVAVGREDLSETTRFHR